MANIAELLREQAQLSKKIADAYGADQKQKDDAKDFFAAVRKRKAGGDRFRSAYTAMKDKDMEAALTSAGWTKESGDIKTGKSTWGKKGSSLKISIEDGKFKVINGTQIVTGPLPLEDLQAYLSKPITQPAQNRHM